MSADNFNAELLSAYLDGEVTDAERALVEERLASDPAAAELLQELRAASDAVRGLPRERVDGDFVGGVLAALEDEPSAATVTLASARESLWQRPGVRRGLAWASLAAAACLMLVVLQPGDQEPRERRVAQAPADRPVQHDRFAKAPHAIGELNPKGTTPPREGDMPELYAAAPEATSRGGVKALADESNMAEAAPASPAGGRSRAISGMDASRSAADSAANAPGQRGGGMGGGALKSTLDQVAAPAAPAMAATPRAAVAETATAAESVAAAKRAQPPIEVYRLQFTGDAEAAHNELLAALAAENVSLWDDGWVYGGELGRDIDAALALRNESSRVEPATDSLHAFSPQRVAASPPAAVATDGPADAAAEEIAERGRGSEPIDRPLVADAVDGYLVSLSANAAARLVARLQRQAGGNGVLAGVELRVAPPQPGAAGELATDWGGGWAIRLPARGEGAEGAAGEQGAVSVESLGRRLAGAASAPRGVASGTSDKPAKSVASDSAVGNRASTLPAAGHVRVLFLLEPAPASNE